MKQLKSKKVLVTSYDRDIVCLTKDLESKDPGVPVKRSKRKNPSNVVNE